MYVCLQKQLNSQTGIMRMSTRARITKNAQQNAQYISSFL